MSASPTLRFLTPDHPLYPQERDLRFRVLRAPLGLAPGSERFPFEDESLHLVAVIDGRVVGCVLFHPESDEEGRLFQMAVDPAWRGQGLGSRLVRTLEIELRRRAFTGVHLHARVDVAPFYGRLGYVERGEPFVEIGIAHVEMRRDLERPLAAGAPPPDLEHDP